ncbi:DNA polymerase III subunit delta [Sphingomonas japonica]|uniref:DNA-directed DNA polymerase n=1 Tax=Sphingomonas japonica TaxID=511662 RepID=A0ABX0U2E5_9SPHN|nr:DNA polymerase III subunit delta [Sphingomonas japonica]NIJ23502.1 DNA polymerase-3 subunit delta [Sphingomonas japonica]
MKVKPDAVRQAIDRGAGDLRLILLHGPDESAAQELAAQLGRRLGPDAERVDLDAAALKANPGRLADEAASLSLFGDKRWIRATIGEESHEAVNLLIASQSAVNPVVAIACGVKSSGKLVKLAEATRGVLSCACYVPEGADAARIAAQVARDHGVRLAPGAAARLAEAVGSDRALLAREVEKIALYLDAAPDRPADADDAVLDAIGAVRDEDTLFAAIAAIVEGDPVATGAEVRAMGGDTSPIPLLRQLGKRLVALAEMRSEIDRGEGVDRVIDARRVHFREKPATVRALRRWSSAHLARGVDRVRAAELAAVARDNAGSVLAWDEALAIARAAQRWG